MGGCRRGRLVILVPRVSLVEGFAAMELGAMYLLEVEGAWAARLARRSSAGRG